MSPQRRQRIKTEMLFAHLKRILKLDRCDYEDRTAPARAPASRPSAQNLRKLAKLIPMPMPKPA